MSRVSRTAISVPRELMRDLDYLLSRLNLRSRSKAISEAITLYIAERYWALSDVEGEVAGAIIMVYDHHKGSEITGVQHRYLDLIRSTSHVHIDEERCMEVLMVLGPLSRVRELFKELQALGVAEVLKPFLVPRG
jgi:CopG family nickel-responsive transcriptional regulator